MRVRTLILGAFLLLAAAEASAQTCLGLPSFSEGLYQASAGVAFTDGAQRVGGGLAIGSEDLFAGGRLTFTNVSDIDATATSFAANGGASFLINERERIEACPVASVIITGGPDVGDIDVHGVGLRAGGRLGVVAYESGDLEVVPTFGLDLAYDRVTAELAGVETSTGETYVIARAGVGFILNRRLGLVSSLGVPLGLTGGDPEFSIVVAYTFGR
ncbi:MAG: hypothetical protein ACRD26_02600 [Vicinamibacterales bacterium]